MLKVVFFATPQIAVNSLMKLLNFADIHVVAVVTQPDRPAGRGNKIIESPVKKAALKNSIPVFQPTSIRKDEELILRLQSMEPDFFVTFAFGQILSQDVIDIPKFGTINLHASLLPEYRGANPIQRAIYNGDKQTGITTMLTVLELDASDICLSEKINISENMTIAELSDVIEEKSAFLIYRTLKGLSTSNITPVKQDESLVTFADKFHRKDEIINWSNTAESIHNQVRAFSPSPCAYTCFQDKTVKIVETRLIKDDYSQNKLSTGQIISVMKEGIIVKTPDNAILVTKVKPENKSIMSAYDWSNGVRLTPGLGFESERNE